MPNNRSCPNTYASIQQGVSLDPEKIALRFFLQATNYSEEYVYSYEDMLGLITQAANMFHDLGVGKDDVVSMLLPNIPQAYFTIFGAQAAGMVNPINPLLEPDVIASLMRAANTKVLVTIAPFPTSDLWQKVASIVEDVPSLETILQVDLINYLSGIKRWGAKMAGVASESTKIDRRARDGFWANCAPISCRSFGQWA